MIDITLNIEKQIYVVFLGYISNISYISFKKNLMERKINVLLTCMGGYGALTLLEGFKRASISEKINFIG